MLVSDRMRAEERESKHQLALGCVVPQHGLDVGALLRLSEYLNNHISIANSRM